MPEFEEGQLPEPLSNKEIFQLIWTDPVSVFTVLRHYHINQWTYGLLALVGIVNVLNQFYRKHYADKFENTLYFVGSIILFALISISGFIIYAEMVSRTGKWLKGRASSLTILRVMAFAQLPLIATLAFQIPCSLIFGMDLFKSISTLDNSETLRLAITIVWYTIYIIMSFWSLTLTVWGLAELQNFSIWKSFLNYMLPAFIILAIVGIPLGILLYMTFKDN